ncbi:hypothetical protein AJ88_29800 [Mesorhizobium amorphae CCBAU 01583]|nr:hypothetical protein AJ88_29800 [Mesorhizobium amorphae CCBAU 01583]
MSDASEQRERQAARLTRHAGLGGLEMLAARYRDHAYALHTHPTYVFGVVVGGVEKLRSAAAIIWRPQARSSPSIRKNRMMAKRAAPPAGPIAPAIPMRP